MAHYLSLSTSTLSADEPDADCCFGWLPRDIHLLVLSNLEVGDCVSCFRTCRSFAALAKNAGLWAAVYERTFGMCLVRKVFLELFAAPNGLLAHVPLEIPAEWVFVRGKRKVVRRQAAPFPIIPHRWLCIASTVRAGQPRPFPEDVRDDDEGTEADDADDDNVGGGGGGVAAAAPDEPDAAIAAAAASSDEEAAAAPLDLCDGLGVCQSAETGTSLGLYHNGQLVMGLYAPPAAEAAWSDGGSSAGSLKALRFMYGGQMWGQRWDGFGVTAFQSGGYYLGEFKGGDLHGEGCLSYRENDVYDGCWVHNVKHGFGTYQWVSGNTYTGPWVENRREGKLGELKWQNGDKYIGEWIDNRRTGQGVLRWSQARGGGVYEGEFFDNQLHGWGRFSFRGIQFLGEWEADRREGRGVLRWDDGDWFEGRWVAGGRQGPGVFHEVATGTAHPQVWDEPADIKYSQVKPLKFPPPPRSGKQQQQQQLQQQQQQPVDCGATEFADDQASAL